MKFDPMNPHPPVTRTFMIGPREIFPGKRKTENGKRRGGSGFVSRFPFPVFRPVSYDSDLRVVPDQKPMNPWPFRAWMDADVRADEGVRDPHRDALNTRPLEDDRVLNLTAVDEAVRTDGSVGADEGVADLRARANDRRASNRRTAELRSRLDDDLALNAAARVD